MLSPEIIFIPSVWRYLILKYIDKYSNIICDRICLKIFSNKWVISYKKYLRESHLHISFLLDLSLTGWSLLEYRGCWVVDVFCNLQAVNAYFANKLSAYFYHVIFAACRREHNCLVSIGCLIWKMRIHYILSWRLA